ncbi:SRPBCC family protein [Sorangium sp. So ce291]|uniref:SRPBCC family protein n=1 Tax=Sorangium sp. So ce291 TaxID=3133294 RepID=UPI003F604CCA
MDASKESEPQLTSNRTTVEPKSDREIVVTRTFDAPARIVFQAWTTPELFRRWWIPKSMPVPLLSYEADIRAGGSYRLVFGHDAAQPMAFFGTYLEVTPHSRIVWTNDEAGDDGAVTTVTLEEKGGKTLQVLHELYRSKQARDAALASGAYSGMGETFEQLEELLVTLGTTARSS